jgi:hypothetical protein
MTTINSLSEIKNQKSRIYVRWSKSFDLDKKRGYSVAYGTQAEAGLSVCEIDKSWDDWRILRQLQEYKFASNGQGQCWLITGDECGRGQDNEPLLKNANLIGKVSNKLTSTDWLLMWRDEMIEKYTAEVNHPRDEWNKNYAEKMLQKLNSQDRNVLQRVMFTGA